MLAITSATIPIAGHPSFLAATSGNPTGKVYVVAQDSNQMTVIRTDTDAIQTTIPLQGNGIQVRVTAPGGMSRACVVMGPPETGPNHI